MNQVEIGGNVDWPKLSTGHVIEAELSRHFLEVTEPTSIRAGENKFQESGVIYLPMN